MFQLLPQQKKSMISKLVFDSRFWLEIVSMYVLLALSCSMQAMIYYWSFHPFYQILLQIPEGYRLGRILLIIIKCAYNMLTTYWVRTTDGCLRQNKSILTRRQISFHAWNSTARCKVKNNRPIMEKKLPTTLYFWSA